MFQITNNIASVTALSYALARKETRADNQHHMNAFAPLFFRLCYCHLQVPRKHACFSGNGHLYPVNHTERPTWKEVLPQTDVFVFGIFADYVNREQFRQFGLHCNRKVKRSGICFLAIKRLQLFLIVQKII